MKTIVVIDDESTVHEQIKTAIADDNTSILSVSSSRHAIDYLNSAGNCDLLLIASRLPVSHESVLMAVKPDERFSKNWFPVVLKKPFTNDQLKTFLVNLE